jgi:UDP-N-acetylglucosamine--N-acetylmuramyl-(pentapeptide) pyrophosphoryl-undecaprenol N-acetylglucosamine transferase
MTILISGGHLTPALALIDYIQRNHTDNTVRFVGRRYSQEATKQLSQEQTEVEKRHIPFIPFQSPRLTTRQSLFKVLALPFRLANAVIQAHVILSQEKPDVFVSFGGYLAVPLALAAWMKRIPVVTHEQTRAAGFANQLIAQFATKVAISFPETNSFFPQHKVTITGNPIRQAALEKNDRLPAWIEQKPDKPLLLITCGNQGSNAINNTVVDTLDQLTQEWTVVHLTGNPTSRINYSTQFSDRKNQLTATQQSRYYFLPWVSGDDLSWLYTHADAAIARAGANTVLELTVRKIPTLFIPLPVSHRDEQRLNAQALTTKGAALLLEQKNLNPQTLLDAVAELSNKRKVLQEKLALITIPTDGDEKLYQMIVSVVHHAA